MDSLSIVTPRKARFIGTDAKGYIVVVVRVCVYSPLMVSSFLMK